MRRLISAVTVGWIVSFLLRFLMILSLPGGVRNHTDSPILEFAIVYTVMIAGAISALIANSRQLLAALAVGVLTALPSLYFDVFHASDVDMKTVFPTLLIVPFALLGGLVVALVTERASIQDETPALPRNIVWKGHSQPKPNSSISKDVDRPSHLEETLLKLPSIVRKAIGVPILFLSVVMFTIISLPAVDAATQTLGHSPGSFLNGYSLFIFIAGIPGLFIALPLFWLGKSCTASYAEDVLRRDKRAPVLYLRSFADDGHVIPLDPQKAVYESVGFRGPFAITKKLETFEEYLTRVFKKLGPVIALSTPNQGLPPAGAARILALGPDNDWQERVKQLIDGSTAVLLIAGGSEGLMWELRQTVERGALSKTWIVFPPTDDAADRYARVKAALLKMGVTSIEKSDPPHDMLCLRFGADGQPIFMAGPNSRKGYKGLVLR